jgi:hypothetical protein
MAFDSKKFGKVFRPIALVEMQSYVGEWKVFYPEIDSGAIITVLNKSDCALLGYELTDGDHFLLSGVLGGETPAYIHTVGIRIGEETFPARVAFTDGKNHKQLLGRLDIFNKFQMCFAFGSQTLFTTE